MPAIGDEVYERLVQPPGLAWLDQEATPPAVRLAAQIARRLAGPYGGGGGHAPPSLAARILHRLGGGGGPGSALPVSGTPPLLIMRRVEPRLTEPGRRPRRWLEDDLADDWSYQPLGWPQIPHAVSAGEEPPRWQQVADERHLGYAPPPTLPQISVPPLNELLRVGQAVFEDRAPPPPPPVPLSQAPALEEDTAPVAPGEAPAPEPTRPPDRAELPPPAAPPGGLLARLGQGLLELLPAPLRERMFRRPAAPPLAEGLAAPLAPNPAVQPGLDLPGPAAIPDRPALTAPVPEAARIEGPDLPELLISGPGLVPTRPRRPLYEALVRFFRPPAPAATDGPAPRPPGLLPLRRQEPRPAETALDRPSPPPPGAPPRPVVPAMPTPPPAVAPPVPVQMAGSLLAPVPPGVAAPAASPETPLAVQPATLSAHPGSPPESPGSPYLAATRGTDDYTLPEEPAARARPGALAPAREVRSGQPAPQNPAPVPATPPPPNPAMLLPLPPGVAAPTEAPVPARAEIRAPEAAPDQPVGSTSAPVEALAAPPSNEGHNEEPEAAPAPGAVPPAARLAGVPLYEALARFLRPQAEPADQPADRPATPPPLLRRLIPRRGATPLSAAPDESREPGAIAAGPLPVSQVPAAPPPPALPLVLPAATSPGATLPAPNVPAVPAPSPTEENLLARPVPLKARPPDPADRPRPVPVERIPEEPGNFSAQPAASQSLAPPGAPTPPALAAPTEIISPPVAAELQTATTAPAAGSETLATPLAPSALPLDEISDAPAAIPAAPPAPPLGHPPAPAPLPLYETITRFLTRFTGGTRLPQREPLPLRAPARPPTHLPEAEFPAGLPPVAVPPAPPAPATSTSAAEVMVPPGAVSPAPSAPATGAPEAGPTQVAPAQQGSPTEGPIPPPPASPSRVPPPGGQARAGMGGLPGSAPAPPLPPVTPGGIIPEASGPIDVPGLTAVPPPAASPPPRARFARLPLYQALTRLLGRPGESESGPSTPRPLPLRTSPRSEPPSLVAEPERPPARSAGGSEPPAIMAAPAPDPPAGRVPAFAAPPLPAEMPTSAPPAPTGSNSNPASPAAPMAGPRHPQPGTPLPAGQEPLPASGEMSPVLRPAHGPEGATAREIGGETAWGAALPPIDRAPTAQLPGEAAPPAPGRAPADTVSILADDLAPLPSPPAEPMPVSPIGLARLPLYQAIRRFLIGTAPEEPTAFPPPRPLPLRARAPRPSDPQWADSNEEIAASSSLPHTTPIEAQSPPLAASPAAFTPPASTSPSPPALSNAPTTLTPQGSPGTPEHIRTRPVPEGGLPIAQTQSATVPGEPPALTAANPPLLHPPAPTSLSAPPAVASGQGARASSPGREHHLPLTGRDDLLPGAAEPVQGEITALLPADGSAAAAPPRRGRPVYQALARFLTPPIPAADARPRVPLIWRLFSRRLVETPAPEEAILPAPGSLPPSPMIQPPAGVAPLPRPAPDGTDGPAPPLPTVVPTVPNAAPGAAAPVLLPVPSSAPLSEPARPPAPLPPALVDTAPLMPGAGVVAQEPIHRAGAVPNPTDIAWAETEAGVGSALDEWVGAVAFATRLVDRQLSSTHALPLAGLRTRLADLLSGTSARIGGERGLPLRHVPRSGPRVGEEPGLFAEADFGSARGAGRAVLRPAFLAGTGANAEQPGLGGPGGRGPTGPPTGTGAALLGVSVQRQQAGTSAPPPGPPLWRELQILRRMVGSPYRADEAEPPDLAAWTGGTDGREAGPHFGWAGDWPPPLLDSLIARTDAGGTLPLAHLGQPGIAPPQAAGDFAGGLFGLPAEGWVQGPSLDMSRLGAGRITPPPGNGRPAPPTIQRASAGSMDTTPDGYDSTANDWAAVIQRALDDAAEAGAANLALAGEERNVPTGEVLEGPPPPPAPAEPELDLDELAEQVYSHIRRRLLIEQERNWT